MGPTTRGRGRAGISRGACVSSGRSGSAGRSELVLTGFPLGIGACLGRLDGARGREAPFPLEGGFAATLVRVSGRLGRPVPDATDRLDQVLVRGTELGAEAQKILMSVLATCRQQGKDSFQHLVELLRSPVPTIMNIVAAGASP